MRIEVGLEAKTHSPSVQRMIDKIEMCRIFGWTPSQYNEQKWTEIRKIRNYLRWKRMMEEKHG